jgi:HAD superfamily hydrolase (TIGR01509 family)
MPDPADARRGRAGTGRRVRPATCHTLGVSVRAVIFDFDGLLMDTESTSLASWQWVWRQHGLELDVSGFFADHGGDVNRERYAHLASAVGPAFSLEASHARRVAYREMLHRDLSLSAGIAGWLDQAGALGLRLAVASSSPGDWVRGHLSRAGVLARFEVLACGDDVARAKPDPGVYALALQRLGVPTASAVAVEDTPHGVAAAAAAGLRCIAIPNPHADPARFGAADVVLASAADAELPAVLGSLDREAMAGRGRGAE